MNDNASSSDSRSSEYKQQIMNLNLIYYDF